MNWNIYINGLYALLAFGVLGWILSLFRNNVTHVDSMWSLFFVIAGVVYLNQVHSVTDRSMILLILVTLWAVRLFTYLTWRNWGPHEDHRYAEIRRNNAPNFAFKSIYIVFGFQAVLAWIISLPIYGAISSANPMNSLDYIGIVIVCLGFIWETIADWQLTVFKRNYANKGKVLNTGLWRYSRHPNYFGECMVWWGLYLIALAGGAWWAIFSPILMTLLLLKVSGVALLEKTIVERRPEYAAYVQSTNAFIPCKPKENNG
jgi:steroid 5-alpha reductase family enzyme